MSELASLAAPSAAVEAFRRDGFFHAQGILDPAEVARLGEAVDHAVAVLTEIAFDSPRNVAAVRMQTAERSFADYPRDLAIETVEAAGVRSLFHGPVLRHFGRAFVNNNSYPTIEIVLPDNLTRTLRIRQLGTTQQEFWSIHELTLMERSR